MVSLITRTCRWSFLPLAAWVMIKALPQASSFTSLHNQALVWRLTSHSSTKRSTCCRLSPPQIAPEISPATGFPNRFYEWKHGQRIRYQSTNHDGTCNGPPVVLIHGLFVNSDHWRKTLLALRETGYAAYALDLFGCGYSDKPPADSEIAQLCNGERRFDCTTSPIPSILASIELGSANGRSIRVRDIELRHPCQSPYNFYTWSELVTDFCQNVVLPECSKYSHVTLVTNSIGTITGLQAVLDTPDLYNGVFVVAPNFRELHSAEVPLSKLCMPLIRSLQKVLRERGQGLFDALAKPDTVRQILNEPYAIKEQVDDVLVSVLLDPLLTPGASKVVFDTLSYSAGPLPEQQLSIFPKNKPVWVGYGTADPWTPGPRVEALLNKDAVERVEAWPGVGHCPHDEAPEMVNTLLLEFLERVQRLEAEASTTPGEAGSSSTSIGEVAAPSI